MRKRELWVRNDYKLYCDPHDNTLTLERTKRCSTTSEQYVENTIDPDSRAADVRMSLWCSDDYSRMFQGFQARRYSNTSLLPWWLFWDATNLGEYRNEICRSSLFTRPRWFLLFWYPQASKLLMYGWAFAAQILFLNETETDRHQSERMLRSLARRT